MFFSQNIKLLRKRRGRTQDDVAHALGMKRSTLSGYENDVAQPSMETLIAFSNFFNIAIDTLVRVNIFFFVSFIISGSDRFGLHEPVTETGGGKHGEKP